MAHYVVFARKGLFPAPIGRAEMVLLKDLGLNINLMMSEARKKLKEITPYSSGHMQNTVKTWGSRVGTLGGFRFYLGWRKQDFGAKYYPPYVLYGTGVYGMFRTPILPKKSPFLAWQDESGNWRKATSVRGQRPQGLLKRAFDGWVEWFNRYVELRRVFYYRSML